MMCSPQDSQAPALGIFFEMKGLGTIVVGNKDSAGVGNGDPAMEKNSLFPVS